MGGILSQREIDALLSALPIEGARVSDTSTNSKPVKIYDFRHPDKFSKDQIRTLELLHDQFARRAGISLSAHLRTLVQVTLVSIDQGVYDEFVQQVPNPAVLYQLTLEPLPGRAILEIHPSVAFIIVDRLLGGYGKALNKSRELTDVELALMESVVWEILAGIKESWMNVTTLSPKLGDAAFTPQFLQVALPSDICLIVSFEVKIVENAGIMRLCLPYIVLEPIVGQLTAQAWYASSRKALGTQEQGHLRRNLETVRVSLVTVLGVADITVEELLNLQKGDVIPLEKPTKAGLTITLNGRPKFTGRPGTRGRRMAIRVSEVLEEEEDDDDGE